MNNEKFYQTSWFMWLMLLFITPIGIFLMYKNKRFQPKTRKIITSIFAVWFIFICISSNYSSPKENLNIKTPTVQTDDSQKQSSEETTDTFTPSTTNTTNANQETTTQDQSVTNTQQNNDEKQVVVTPTGKKYHLAGCKTLARSKTLTTMTVKEAKEKGYEPCEVCDPPQ